MKYREIGNGAQGRDRTTDTVIFSHVLYQLSYLGFLRPGRGLGRGRAGFIEARFRAVQNAEKTADSGRRRGTGQYRLALICGNESGACRQRATSMPLDLNQIF